MRIYKNDIIKASAISTGADRGVLLCSIVAVFNNRFGIHVYSGRNIGC